MKNYMSKASHMSVYNEIINPIYEIAHKLSNLGLKDEATKMLYIAEGLEEDRDDGWEGSKQSLITVEETAK